MVTVLGEAVREALNASENASPAEAVAAVTKQLGQALGATAVALLIADLSGRALVRLTEESLLGLEDSGGQRRDGVEAATTLPFDGGPAEQVLRTQQAQVLPPGHPAAAGLAFGRWTVLAPISERGDTVGLLALSLPERPSTEVVEEIGRVAHLLAFVLVAARRHTDLFEWGQRTAPFSLSAEIQRRLLPASLTCEGGAFTLSAWLEPAESVGGDSFDYSTARDTLRLSLTDAMGHGVAAALAATLCVSSLRGTRRRGGSLLEQAGEANTAMIEHAADIAADVYVTGLLGELDLRTGELTLVNAGHVSPFLARARDELPQPVELPADLPFGLFPGTRYRPTVLRLQEGDRLVLVTDGMLERNAAKLDLPEAIRAGRDLHPREATRDLSDQLLHHTGGRLVDDATLMVLDWNGHHDAGRSTHSGAEPATASDPLPSS